MNNKNIVLIGMPSAGKSTIGEQLAKDLGMEFIDTDTVIKNRENRALRDIVKEDGLNKFLQVQENAILGINIQNHVIATGGSVIYSENSMRHLKANGITIYLELKFNEIEERVTPERRFARSNGQTLLDLYNERVPLYEKYADFTINCSDKKVDDIVSEIKFAIQ